MTPHHKSIVIALRDFALPSPRTGSIEAHSGYGRAAVEGREIHGRVQKRRARSDASYEAEVAVSRTFERSGYVFRIDGRMDGIFRQDPPRIEEIKTSFGIRELGRRLSQEPLQHPYCLQLLSYGYFHWLEHGVIPKLSFHLVSTRTRDSLDLELALDLPAYEQWLASRLAELAGEAEKSEKRAARRRRTASAFSFPFDALRPGQTELMQTIERGMRLAAPLLIQAPTGLGKTVGVLYPALKEALGRGRKVVYITPKNSQHAVAEDAIERFNRNGAKIKSLTITAKGKICFQNEPLCDPDHCEYARDYYGKVERHALLDVLARKRRLKARHFRDLGGKHLVCPFELQLDGAREADVVICDYNYVFAPRSAFGRLARPGIGRDGRPNLVIDEAHNLPSRAMGYYSPELSTTMLDGLRKELRELPEQFRTEADELLDRCRDVIISSGEGAAKPARIDPPAEAFLGQDAKLRAFLSRYLDSDVAIMPRDPVMRLCFSWSEFAEALGYVGRPEHPEFFTTFNPHARGGSIRITCCDASAMLRDCYDEYEQVVLFSATLKPFEYYAKLSGLDPGAVLTAEFGSPFPAANRKLLIIPQVSTKYSEREGNYAKIADAVRRIACLRRGNYFVFFPSFEFLERVLALFQAPPDFDVLRQERDMRMAEVETVLARLRAGDIPVFLFAVQGGMFSEGIDYPGDMAIGAFVVGPPLPNFDLERELMREYYEKQYQAGFDYAYAIPAMARAVQAAGRVIRSENDRGLIVLMDSRFVLPGFSRAMPADWFSADANELVSESILKEVAGFWKRTECGIRNANHSQVDESGTDNISRREGDVQKK